MKITRHVHKLSAAVVASLILTACGGGGGGGAGGPATPTKIADIAVPNVTAGTNFSFDLGTTDGTKYYFTDRNNAAVDVIDIASKTFANSIKGTGANAFAGSNASNAKAGPDGVNAVGALLYAGDVNSVKIIDPATSTVLNEIVVSTGGVRADEGCLDPVHNLYMISSPEENTPFATFIDTKTQQIVAKVTFTDSAGNPSAGLEQCRYDADSDSFFVNNDGTTANPHGEFDKLPGAAIRAIPAGATVNYTALAGVGTFTEGNCDPTGLAVGPGTDVAVSCREGTTGAPLLVQIMNRTTGAIVASLNAGGADQLEYDATSNRYYGASSRWTASGKAGTNGACSAAAPCTPVLTIIDASTRTVVDQIPTGNNAHSVAIDPATGLVFLPYSSAASPAGCATCAANGFINGGVLVFSTR